MTCSAKQFSDQMVCKPCDLTWDVNDPDPPKCRRMGGRAMNKREFSDKLHAQLAPLEIEDIEVVSIPDVGNIMRFRIKVDGEVKYGSFKFNQLDDELLAEIAKVVKPLPGCPHCGYRHPPDGVCI